MSIRIPLRSLSCAALLLAVAFTSGASGDVFELKVDATRLVIPLPEGLARASIEQPEMVRQARAIHGIPNGVIEVLLPLGCPLSKPERKCPATFELVVLPERITGEEWPQFRKAFIREIREDERLLQRKQTADAMKRAEAEVPGVDVFMDKSRPMVLVREDDPRSVRARFERPILVTVGEARVEMVQMFVRLPVRGQFMAVYAMHMYPYGKVDERAVQRLDAEVDAFLTDLYALNPE